ncbi:unnamed protein product [Hymenolepis diminuta]|uniref:EF-hand domain-containing protein n=1 Tax=Hymenolepis diminuta TaxID=6216 RepID=A0A0R3SQR0_HYMDI|nr:unnamed protein product [Hymenolepis diminuta]VUZ49133.1 unnamed protein product [Hymenolepis diminuta]
MPCSQTVRLFLESIDTDKSGTIDAQELLTALENSNIKVKHIETFIAQYDKNNDGKLDFDELMDFFSSLGL